MNASIAVRLTGLGCMFMGPEANSLKCAGIIDWFIRELKETCVMDVSHLCPWPSLSLTYPVDLWKRYERMPDKKDKLCASSVAELHFYLAHGFIVMAFTSTKLHVLTYLFCFFFSQNNGWKLDAYMYIYLYKYIPIKFLSQAVLFIFCKIIDTFPVTNFDSYCLEIQTSRVHVRALFL